MQQNVLIPPSLYSQHKNVFMPLGNTFPAEIRSTTTVNSLPLEPSMSIMGSSSFAGSNNINMNSHLNQQQMISQKQNIDALGMGSNNSGVMVNNMTGMHMGQSMISTNNTGFISENNFQTGMGLNSANNQMFFNQMPISVMTDNNMMNPNNVPMSSLNMENHSLNTLDPSVAAYQAQMARQQHTMKMASSQQQTNYNN